MKPSEKNRRSGGSGGSGGGHARPARETRVLRIIGGTWRGRKLRFPPSPEIRPTPDRVRETLFNWLAPRLRGARCLDLFAGSGALGLESLSRGAAHVTFVERDPAAARELRARLSEWGATGGHVEQGDALRFLTRPPVAARAAPISGAPQSRSGSLSDAAPESVTQSAVGVNPAPEPATQSVVGVNPAPESATQSAVGVNPAPGFRPPPPAEVNPPLDSAPQPSAGLNPTSGSAPPPSAGLNPTSGSAGRADAELERPRWARGAPFDIVFLDPPFDSNLLREVPEQLEKGGWLSPGALIYIECPAEGGLPPLPAGWTVTKAKEAGEVGYHLVTRNLQGREGE